MGYTDERNAQILISLLKQHGIRKVIASPGTTNICFIASIQSDTYFEIYSAPDERSAGYIACGMSAECGEPIVISCTGATASRNYMPSLTEAYYRKLPILAVTSSRRSSRIGHNMDQVTDRTLLPKDVAKLSVQAPLVLDNEIEWADTIAINKAILELRHRGNGPVHINLETNYSTNYNVDSLPEARAIYRITEKAPFPRCFEGEIVIAVGSHLRWSDELTDAVDTFCEKWNAIVLHDNTSNYKGKYGILACLTSSQQNYIPLFKKPTLAIHIGDVAASSFRVDAEEVWRVNPDGELRDTFGNLKYVFEMDEIAFFEHYNFAEVTESTHRGFFQKCSREYKMVKDLFVQKADKLPFSNAWITYSTARVIPDNAVLHFGIQNSLRCWNYFELPKNVFCYSNTGGFGIDGSLSSLIGAALASPEKVFFCFLGDLAFFYDMNSLGNRHLPDNIRILMVNNGKGTEFRLKGNPGFLFGEDADKYIAAGGHYGNKSENLVRHYVQDLGFVYLSASNKEEFAESLKHFISPYEHGKPILMEMFTDSADERDALWMISNIVVDSKLLFKKKVKDAIKSVVGEKRALILKKAFNSGH